MVYLVGILVMVYPRRYLDYRIPGRHLDYGIGILIIV